MGEYRYQINTFYSNTSYKVCQFIMDIRPKKVSFKGGLREGMWNTTWPFITFDISQNSLTLCYEKFFWLKERKLIFTKDEVIKIEIKKYFPIIGYGIKIYHRNESYSRIIIFWCISFHFNKLLSALKEYGWAIS